MQLQTHNGGPGEIRTRALSDIRFAGHAGILANRTIYRADLPAQFVSAIPTEILKTLPDYEVGTLLNLYTEGLRESLYSYKLPEKLPTFFSQKVHATLVFDFGFCD